MFKLHSPYKPAGDQPKAIKQLTANLRQGARHQTLLGITGSGKTFTMANVIAKIQKPTLIISHNKTLAAQLASEFKEFFPENAVHYFVSYYDYYQPEAYLPSSDTYIEKETQINEEIERLRHASTQDLLIRPDVIVVASVSCIYGLGAPQEYQSQSFTVKEGDRLDRQKFLKQLASLQYQRNDLDCHRGTYRVRGDVVEIFPVFSTEEIIRIEWLGGQIEKISWLDSLTRQSIDRARTDHWPVSANNQVRIFPATHYLAPPDKITDVLRQIRQDLKSQINKFKEQGKLLEAQRIAERVKYDLEMIKNAGYCQGIENYSRYFDGRRAGEPAYTLLDYFLYNKIVVASKNPPFTKGRVREGLKFGLVESLPPPASPLTKGRKKITRHADQVEKKQLETTPPIVSTDFLTFIDESHMTIPQIRGMYAGDRSRKKNLVSYGFRLSAALDNRPLNFQEFEQKIGQVVYVSATPGPYELTKCLDKVDPSTYQGEGREGLKLGFVKSLPPLASPLAMGRKNIYIIEQIVRPTGLLDPEISVRPTKNQIDDLIREIKKRVKKKQRVLITTLTKRLAEELDDFLQEVGIKSHYLHSEIKTLERLDILNDLRRGQHDVVVGINLLREGLDLPEVSLVAILDADTEGFLRSDSALIQVMGRAARHLDGFVIMYADNITGSMGRAIAETKRRRRIQLAYNQKHHITPQGIKKAVRQDFILKARQEKTEKQKRLEHLAQIPPDRRPQAIKELAAEMDLAARNWEFEKATELRDLIAEFKKK